MFETASPSRGTTFAVDDVIPAQTPIWTEPAHDHVVRRFRRRVAYTSDPARPLINVPRGQLDSHKGISPEFRVKFEATLVNRCHPLIDAVGNAFSDHRPLVLSPDSIWMTVEQGFAHHVAANAETLRPHLVRHEEKQELTATVYDLEPASLETAIASFSSQIRSATNPILHEALLCDFSTTTPHIRTASEVVLMDCYASYFEYSLMCVCGIPSITLTGTLEDWERMRAKIEVFEPFQLEWWVARLRPIFDEFIRTVQGRPSLEFWQAIYKPKQAYGSSKVTGWIADLFPYLNDPPRRVRNHILQHPRENWAVLVPQGVSTNKRPVFDPTPGISPDSFPSGLASVPIKLTRPDVTPRTLDLIAGFLGVEQDAADLSLSPAIGWAIAEPAPSTPILL